MKKPSYLACLAICLLSFFFATGQVNAATFYLNQSNTLADGINYAQVDVAEIAGNLKFNVTALDPNDWRFDKFYFNLNVEPVTVTMDEPSKWKLDTDQNVSSFGEFSNEIVRKGNFGPASEFSFTVTGVNALSIANLVANGEGLIFAAHSKCSTNGGNDCVAVSGLTSHFIAGPSPSNVPIPAAVWLFGSALAGLGSVARRKR